MMKEEGDVLRRRKENEGDVAMETLGLHSNPAVLMKDKGQLDHLKTISR